jgi:NAD(P)-dependent dehydrogenase (short-subunit alcohol dehydrogenase family)
VTAAAGRVAVVTGAAGGIGRQFALRLAQQGFAVAIGDVRDSGHIAAEIQARGGQAAAAYRLDVADPSAVAGFAQVVLAEFGRADVLVNNAAHFGRDSFPALTHSLFTAVMQVNVGGPFLLSQQFLPGMLDQGWGRIVNVVSDLVARPGPGSVAYVTSKSALVGFTRALAAEVSDRGVTVNAVAPGLTRTETAERDLPAEAFQRVLAVQAIKRSMLPTDYAGTLAWLVSDDAATITGQTISMGGGSLFL